MREACVFIFLRELRHRLLDAAMQEKLAAMYSPVERGENGSRRRNSRWHRYCGLPWASRTTKPSSSRSPI